MILSSILPPCHVMPCATPRVTRCLWYYHCKLQEFECESGDAIVLACDGVFDVLSSSKAWQMEFPRFVMVIIKIVNPFLVFSVDRYTSVVSRSLQRSAERSAWSGGDVFWPALSIGFSWGCSWNIKRTLKGTPGISWEMPRKPWKTPRNARNPPFRNAKKTMESPATCAGSNSPNFH